MKKVFIIFVVVFMVSLAVMMNWPNANKELFTAIREKQVEEVQKILKRSKINLDPPSRANQVNKPLAYAAAYGNLDIVKLLLQKGADINGQVAYGDVPIIKAMEHGHTDIVEYLITNGADVNIPNAFGVSPFIGFCGMGELRLARISLSHGADIHSAFELKTGESKGKKNWTPLQSGVVYGQLEIVKLLLVSGADPYVKDFEGKNCFELAKNKGQDAVLNYLMDKYNLKK